MNAIAEQIAGQLTVDDALAAVKATVVALRTVEAAHLSDEASLSRGRDRLTSAEAALEKIATDNADAIARHARRLEEQTRSGSTAPVPQLTVSDAHRAKELIAERTATAAKQMMVNLQTTVDASGGKVQAARRVVETALSALRAAEVHHFIWDGLELLDQFKGVMTQVLVRTEGSSGSSSFGDEIHDRDPVHQKLRRVWNTIEREGALDTPRDQLGAAQPSLISARAALAKRDAELLTDKEQTQ